MSDQIAPGVLRTQATGAVLIVSVFAKIALFLAHPEEQATDFAGFIAEEAANQTISGVVHGGFALIMALQLAGSAVFCGRLGWNRQLVIAALALFAVGALLQIASMLIEGVLIPALAVHYLDAPTEIIASAQSSFVLCDIAATALRPWGLLLAALGIMGWGAALLRHAAVTGILTLAVGAAMIAALAVSVMANPQFAIIAVLGVLLWALIAGSRMLRRPKIVEFD